MIDRARPNPPRPNNCRPRLPAAAIARPTAGTAASRRGLPDAIHDRTAPAPASVVTCHATSIGLAPAPGARMPFEISSSSRIRSWASPRSDVHRSACRISHTLRRGSPHSSRNSIKASTMRSRLPARLMTISRNGGHRIARTAAAVLTSVGCGRSATAAGRSGPNGPEVASPPRATARAAEPQALPGATRSGRLELARFRGQVNACPDPVPQRSCSLGRRPA